VAAPQTPRIVLDFDDSDRTVTRPARFGTLRAKLGLLVAAAAVFGTGGPAGWGSAGLSLVPLSALPPVRC
jgi:hypothetical protein